MPMEPALSAAKRGLRITSVDFSDKVTQVSNFAYSQALSLAIKFFYPKQMGKSNLTITTVPCPTLDDYLPPDLRLSLYVRGFLCTVF